MARIRTIKPAFFLNEQVAALPFQWRLLFVGLWTQADREGRLEDRPVRLKAMLFPYDDLDVNDGLGCLVNAGLITRYEGNTRRLISIPTWAKHQQPHIKEAQSEYPPPVTAAQKHRARTVPASQEGKGTGAGKEQEGNGRTPREVRADFERFWAVYPRKIGKDAALMVWLRRHPNIEEVLAAVQAQAPGWDDPKFIPHPRTWLHQGRWMDVVEPAPRTKAAQAPVYEPWVCPHVEDCAHQAMCRLKDAMPHKYPRKAVAS